MIILLSPAKTLDYNHNKMGESLPDFVEETMVLNGVLRKKSVKSLRSLMNISEKLAKENYERNNVFKNEFDEENSRAAIYAFKGDVYRGLDIDTLKKSDIKFANKHVRILSGLYGLLRPMDKMQPYRLEMGTGLKVKRKKNLYEFWDAKLTNTILGELEDQKSRMVINLASNEYFKAVDHPDLKNYIINVQFKEYKGDVLRFVSFNAKRARGLMTRYIIQNRIKKVEGLKGFDFEDYKYDESLSTENNLMFTR